MSHRLHFPLLGLLLAASAAASAETSLSGIRLAGLGLQPAAGAVTFASDRTFGGEAAQVWQRQRPSSAYSLYSGERETPRLGLRSAESYGGIVYTLPGGWGTSLEAGYMQGTFLAPRRYALTGQLHTSFGNGRSLSVGLKYRAYDVVDAALAPGAAERPGGNGYALAPWRRFGSDLAPAYQLQMSYQYSAAGSLGFALGREIESFTPFIDGPATTSSRQQVMFTGQHWFTPSWALSYDVMSQDVMTPQRTFGLRLGVRYRF